MRISVTFDGRFWRVHVWERTNKVCPVFGNWTQVAKWTKLNIAQAIKIETDILCLAGILSTKNPKPLNK